jgi:hypothetical protein
MQETFVGNKTQIPRSCWRRPFIISTGLPECLRLSSTYLFNYLLTPCSRVLLEKLIVLQLVKKFPAFYGTRRFITAFTSTRHLSLSWASSIQSMPPTPNPSRLLKIHLRLGLPSGSFKCINIEIHFIHTVHFLTLHISNHEILVA